MSRTQLLRSLGLAGASSLVLLSCGTDVAHEADDGTGTEMDPSSPSASVGDTTADASGPGPGKTATSAEPTSGSSSASDPGTTVASADTGSSDTVGGSSEGMDTTAGTGSTGAVRPGCGDGVLDEGEACDDGNLDPNDACTDLCEDAFCGDGIVWAGTEECDDANAEVADGCTPECVREYPYIWAMLMDDSDDYAVYRYTVETDTWDTFEYAPTSGKLSTITSDGHNLYWANLAYPGVFRFDPAVDGEPEWLEVPYDPVLVGFYAQLQWVDGRVYVMPDYPYWFEPPYPVYLLQDGEWSSFQIDEPPALAGSWDPQGEELYVKKQSDLGFFVIDTTSDQIVRSFDVGEAVHEFSQNGSFLDGFFYTRELDGPLQQLDAYDGTQVDTGAVPTSECTATVADPGSELIYIGGCGEHADVFQVYDPADDSLTMLAAPPFGPFTSPPYVSPYFGHTTMVLIYPQP